MVNRRLEHRLLCAEIVDLHWRDKDGAKHKAVANLEDISTSGACLQADFAIPLETTVRIAHAKGELTGNVKHCVYWEIGYFLGIEFDAASRWSVKQLKPGHLLDTRGLVCRSIDRVPSSTVDAQVSSTLVM